MIADMVAFQIMVAQVPMGHALALGDAVVQAWSAGLLAWPQRALTPVQQEGPRSVSDLTPKDTLSIDVDFGAIRFVREGLTTLANVAVDVTIVDLSSGQEIENAVQMALSFPAKPDAEPVVAIVERARGHIVARLRAAANVMEGKSAEALLYGPAV